MKRKLCVNTAMFVLYSFVSVDREFRDKSMFAQGFSACH